MEDEKYAHELYPHPDEGETRPAVDMARYYYAQTQGAFRAFQASIQEWDRDVDYEALLAMVAWSELGFLYDALAQGLGGQEAVDWARRWCHGEALEIVGEREIALGVAWDQIRASETAFAKLRAQRDQARDCAVDLEQRLDMVERIVIQLGDTEADEIDALDLYERLSAACRPEALQ